MQHSTVGGVGLRSTAALRSWLFVARRSVVLTRRRSVIGVDGKLVGASKRLVRLNNAGASGASTTARYACPDCGDRSDFDGECPRCDVALVDATAVAAWQIDQHREADATQWIDAFWSLVAAVAVSFAALLLIRWWTHGDLALSQLGAVVATSLSLIPLRWLSHGVAVRALGARRRSAAHRRLRAAAPVVIANAAEGAEVKLTGATTALRRAHNPGGPTSLAYEREGVETRGGEATNVRRSGGGEFVLDDGSGTQAIVRAQYVTVVGGVEVEGQRIVPEGARVEVVGVCRWEVSASEGAVVHGRSAARVVRVEGSPDRPVILRVIDAAPETTTGVRVSVEAATVDEDERALSASEGARKRVR